jgi:ribosomal protein S18 acetylase RimI-like enzyme
MTVTMDAVHYRDFEENDLDWTLQAMVAGMRETKASERLAAADDREMIEEARSDLERYHYRSGGADKLIVALRDGERIGLVWATMERLHQGPGEAWLLEVFVDPRYRRQGLARELLDRAERWARENGAAAMWLNVGGGNVCALGLYRSQGYAMETMHLSKRL